MNIIFFLIIFSINAFGSSTDSLSVNKLNYGRSEIWWAVGHPFQIRKARRTTQKVRLIIDSVERSGALSDRSGGRLDALKHSLWMALLARDIGRKAALKLGLAHEKTNYRQFKRGKNRQHAAMSKMDSLNNQAGIWLYDSLQNSSNKLYINALINMIRDGKLFILNKDKNGRLLDCHNKPVDTETRRWKAGICIIPSNKKQ